MIKGTLAGALVAFAVTVAACAGGGSCVAYPGTSCQSTTSVDGYDLNVCSS